MKALKRFLAAVLACAACGALPQCSSDPVAGGTETGNPEVTACVMLTFDGLADSSRWDVRAYVPGGVGRLDSAAIVEGSAYGHPGGTLAKRWVERSDTVVGEWRYVTYTLFIDDTLLILDTLYLTDTLHVNDTLVQRVTVFDTTFAVEDGDTTRIIRQRTDIDSVFVVDTVYLPDTLVTVDTLFVRDALVFNDTLSLDSAVSLDTLFTFPGESLKTWFVSDANAPQHEKDSVTLVYSSASGVNYRVTPAGVATAFYVPVPPPNYSVLNERTTVLVTKQLVTAAGAVITENYGDLDGDAELFGNGFQELRFIHTYAFAGDSVIAAADFNAGVDASFASTGDNVLTAVVRRTVTPTRLENVTYSYDPATAPADTLTLSLFEALEDSTLEFCTRTYSLRRGRDFLVGNDDSLSAWRASAVYNSGDVLRMDVDVRMDVAVPYGRAARSAAVKATLWMADGGVGLLDARIDFTAGTVRGSYRRDGETNYIAVDRNGAPLP